MSSITPVYITLELTTGIVGPFRVLAADKIATERTCRRFKFDFADGPRTHTLMAFYAARRLGHTHADDYDAFMTELVDYQISNDLPEDADALDPTAVGNNS